MLKVRVATGLVGGSIVIAACIYLPPFYMAAIFLAFALLCVFEIVQMTYPKLTAITQLKSETDASVLKSSSYRWHLTSVLLIAVLVFINACTVDEASSGRGILVGGLLACIFVSTFSSTDPNVSGVKMLSSVFSVVYGVLPWVAIWDIYLMGDTARYLFLMLAIVWAGDTGAYFGGRFFGKHKLSPLRSPKKTWEGAFAGLLSSVVFSCALKLAYGDAFIEWPWVIGTAIIVGIFGQMGDLVESTIKRFCGVKDSGDLLPGHGGILDRADGLLFAAPPLWFILFTLLH